MQLRTIIFVRNDTTRFSRRDISAIRADLSVGVREAVEAHEEEEVEEEELRDMVDGKLGADERFSTGGSAVGVDVAQRSSFALASDLLDCVAGISWVVSFAFGCSKAGVAATGETGLLSLQDFLARALRIAALDGEIGL